MTYEMVSYKDTIELFSSVDKVDKDLSRIIYDAIDERFKNEEDNQRDRFIHNIRLGVQTTPIIILRPIRISIDSQLTQDITGDES